MNLSSRKVIFYALLLVAVVTGLLIDRSQRASAAVDGTSTQAVLGIEEGTASDFSAIGPPIAAVFQPDRKGGPRDSRTTRSQVMGRVRDAFAPSLAMQKHYRTRLRSETGKKADEAQRKREQMRQIVDAFKNSHLLKGTFVQPDDVWAVINDQILRIGDQMAGFELCRVERYRVLFRKNEATVVLELPDASNTQVPS